MHTLLMQFAAFSGSFFFCSWLASQYFRAAKQLSDSEQFERISVKHLRGSIQLHLTCPDHLSSWTQKRRTVFNSRTQSRPHLCMYFPAPMTSAR